MIAVLPSAEHVAVIGLHVDPTHSCPEAQSLVVEHEVRQPVSPHAYSAHEVAMGAGQVPFPSQVVPVVARPSAHAAGRHATSAPTKAAHVAVVAPSQSFVLQASDVSVAQAARPPCGAPTTATHRPTEPVTSHASHCPLHLVSQHTESAQEPEAHSASTPQRSAFFFVQVPA